MTALKDNKIQNNKKQKIDLDKLKATFQSTELINHSKPDLKPKDVILEEDPLANPDRISES